MRELSDAEQALFKNGQDAEAFLSNPAMADAINELSENLANAILATDVAESGKRERIYLLHTALKELVAIMNHRVSLKANLEAEMADPENE
jgi:hypothetical protein